MNIKNKKHVLLLKGGYGSKRSVPKICKACVKVLRQSNFKVTEFDIATMNIADLINFQADTVADKYTWRCR